MEKKRNSRATSNLKSATTKAKATVKSTVEKIEKTPAAEKTVKAVKIKIRAILRKLLIFCILHSIFFKRERKDIQLRGK